MCQEDKVEQKLNKLNKIENIADPQWDLIDPTPNMEKWFHIFNAEFFDSNINGESIEIEWSKRMKRSAGITYFCESTKFLTIRLSEEVLTYQPRKAFMETFLHEMIHAYLFVQGKNSAHGKEFRKKMNEINTKTMLEISIQHTFLNPKEFVFRCNGPCREQAPHFGFLLRPTKKAPNASDPESREHRKYCIGKFVYVEKSTEKDQINRAKQTSSRRKTINDFSADTPATDSVKPLQRSNSEEILNQPVAHSTIISASNTSNSNGNNNIASINMEVARLELSLKLDEVANHIQFVSDDFDFLSDRMFANYDHDEQRFLDVSFLDLKNVDEYSKDNQFYCILCDKVVRNFNDLISHFEICTGQKLTASVQRIPFYKIAGRNSIQ